MNILHLNHACIKAKKVVPKYIGCPIGNKNIITKNAKNNFSFVHQKIYKYINRRENRLYTISRENYRI